jgi:predicted transcriptional regulator
MPYDSSLDEQLFAKSFETEEGRITVSVYSYNNGAKKLQIVRENKDPEGNLRFAKMGRLTKLEIEGVLPFIQEAISHM